MEMLSYFTQIFEPTTLMWLIIGATVGVILGALPGMSADTGIGIFLPLTFSLSPVAALAALGAIYVTGAYGGNIEAAKKIGELVAKRALEKGIEEVVFDRGGYLYHGRVAALAEAAREAGLKF